MRNKNLDAFEARIKRIAKEEGSKRQLIAGEGELRDTRISAAQIKRAKASQNSSSLILSVPKWGMAFLLGAVAMLIGRLVGHHVLERFMSGADMTELLMRHGGELAIGIVALVTAATFIGFRGGFAKVAMTAGFAMMLVGEADVATHAPGLWEGMFSAEYAAAKLGPSSGMENNLRTIASLLQNNT
ncbi:hypothetical protein [Lentibacter sp. XHP0401]|jgi:hypothetical protein|uniref:hypothetical protein n=1 Tax=Lentibacter sp. XHP0401 TaxID=2984334 RepID=UPI0021E96211|nr:hypothetical protein [Lentibacter sp. XHP0401]MCV2892407.1 hypothetical protein [Lentibacter sp. XHP0401]